MRSHAIVILLIMMLCAAGVSAQFLGQMNTADCLDRATGNSGAYVVLADGATAVVGSIRYGFAELVEGRLRLGYIDPDIGDGGIIFGGDFKYQLWDIQQYQNPFDLAFGGGLQYTDIGGLSIFGLFGSVIGSIPIETNSQDFAFTPYGRLALRFESLSDNGASETEIDVTASLGAKFDVRALAEFYFEVLLDDDTAFLIGAEFLRF